MEDDEPRHSGAGEAAYHAAYLDYLRGELRDAVRSVADPRVALLPSGWSPIELLSHVLHMEQRWFVWGFLGEHVEEPWGDWTTEEPWEPDSDPAARWHVPDDVTVDDLARRLDEIGARTRSILATHSLDEVAADGARFDGDPAELRWICVHVLQEYARHAGHLDVVVELLG